MQTKSQVAHPSFVVSGIMNKESRRFSDDVSMEHLQKINSTLVSLFTTLLHLLLRRNLHEDISPSTANRFL